MNTENGSSSKDSEAFAALAEKLWDSANSVVGVAVVQTIAFLLTLGTSDVLVRYINCGTITWYLATGLILFAFGFYSWIVRRYGRDEDHVRRSARQPEQVRDFARKAARSRQYMLAGILVVTLAAMVVNLPNVNTKRCPPSTPAKTP